MKVGEALFVVWTAVVAIWWIVSDPESAPQQAALAGQALVLVTLPYCVLAALQRARMIGNRDNSVVPRPSQLKTRGSSETSSRAPRNDDLDPDMLTRPGGISLAQSRIRGEKGDDGAKV